MSYLVKLRPTPYPSIMTLEESCVTKKCKEGSDKGKIGSSNLDLQYELWRESREFRLISNEVQLRLQKFGELW